MVLSHQRLISICNVNRFDLGHDSFLFAGVSFCGNRDDMASSHPNLVSMWDMTQFYARHAACHILTTGVSIDGNRDDMVSSH